MAKTRTETQIIKDLGKTAKEVTKANSKMTKLYDELIDSRKVVKKIVKKTATKKK